jgi:hypothetical protein
MRGEDVGLPGITRSILSTKVYPMISGCRTTTSILAFFYAPTLQGWVETVNFLIGSANPARQVLSSGGWLRDIARSALVQEGILYAGMYRTNSDFQHAFSVLSCLYGSTRIFLLFQSFSDEYTVCEWAHKLKDVRLETFNAFRTPMKIEGMLDLARLWKSLEGKQVVTPKFAETYQRLTGVSISPKVIGQTVEATLEIFPLRFSPRTIDTQIASRFKLLEKFSWIVPKSFKEECARGNAFDRHMTRMELLSKAVGAFKKKPVFL